MIERRLAMTSTTTTKPQTSIDQRFSSERATAAAWAEALGQLEAAEIYWLTTVRPDGRPHVTPIGGVVSGDALYFCTGLDERKAKNLEQNVHCVVTTGCNSIDEGTDIVVEGDAARVRDASRLQALAEAWVTKYGGMFRFDVRGDTFVGDEGNVAAVFEVAPMTAFGFGKGEQFSQTRWRFAR
jgi:general stress protein 26